MSFQIRRCIIPCMTALLSASSASAGVIAHFKANGNADDTTGGHSGALMNGAGFGSGVEGQAFSFNGTNQYVTSPPSAEWQFGESPFTVSVWVNFDSVHQGNDGSLPNVLVGCDDSSGRFQKWVLYCNGFGKLAFHVNGSAFIFMQSPGTFEPVPGDWHHCAITRSGSTYRFYVDGELNGVVESDIELPTPVAPLTIGQAEGLGFVDGRIDDVQIYHEALSAVEIGFLHDNPGVAIGDPCAADLNDDGEVDGDDLGTLLGMWGPCAGCIGDFNDDDVVDGDDLGTLLGAWGPCAP